MTATPSTSSSRTTCSSDDTVPLQQAQTPTSSDDDENVLSQLNWECTAARLVPLDDGHTPEGLSQGQYAVYPSEPAAALHVTDHAVDSVVCHAWYETMTSSSSAPAWGTYVTLNEIQQHWQQQPSNQQQSNHDNAPLPDSSCHDV